ncbi:MAG: MFS transporter [Deltaproteobacteria bacterium]|nr:MFS transporter [Deltaproteobacteria bacterium]
MRVPLVPVFARELGASTVDVGMINAGFMLSAMLLAIPLGLVSDRLGRRRLIIAGMAFSGLTSLLLVLARRPIEVGAIYLVSGVGLACFSPAMMSYVGDVSPPSFLGRAYGWLTTALYLGMAIGPGLGGAVAAAGFRTAFLVSAALSAVAVTAAFSRMPAPPPIGRSASSGFAADFREIARNRAVVACWTATFFSTYAWGALYAFFPLYARDAGISVVHTGLIFSSQAAANAIARIPIGHLADRTRRRERYILFGNLLFAVAIGLVGQVRREIPLYFVFLAIGGTMAVTFTAIGAVLSESVDTRVRGLAMGGYNTCIYGGFAVSAATLGTVIEKNGYPAGFALAAGLCAFSSLLFHLVFPRRPGRGSAP